MHFSWSRLQLRFLDNAMILKVSKISIEVEQPQVKVKYTYSGSSLLRQFGDLSIREILSHVT